MVTGLFICFIFLLGKMKLFIGAFVLLCISMFVSAQNYAGNYRNLRCCDDLKQY